jgi:hypothetical protein
MSQEKKKLEAAEKLVEENEKSLKINDLEGCFMGKSIKIDQIVYTI